MFIIADEDIGIVKVAVCEVLSTLADGAKRCDKEIKPIQRVGRIVGATLAKEDRKTVADLLKVDKEVDVGDGICPIVVSGYWVVNTIRIDIRIRK